MYCNKTKEERETALGLVSFDDAVMTSCWSCLVDKLSSIPSSKCLVLPLHGETLRDCMEKYFESHVMEGPDNKYECGLCGDQQALSTKQNVLLSTPKILLIQIMRFWSTGEHEGKYDTAVECPESLDIAAYVEDPKCQTQYELRGIVQHHGASMRHQGVQSESVYSALCVLVLGAYMCWGEHHQVHSAVFLNVAVCKGVFVLKPLKVFHVKSLQVYRDALLVLDLLLHICDGVTWFYFETDSRSNCLHKYQHVLWTRWCWVGAKQKCADHGLLA